MSTNKNHKSPQTNKPGPQPERLKINGDWKDAVKRAVNTPPPENTDEATDEEPKDNDRDTEA